ncbi:MAG TPA: TetR/AcrR family transcriptional regulator [Gammaproteobacteria bacterium]|jgi:TetR/AcrR family transcriptional repressor of nem operon
MSKKGAETKARILDTAQQLILDRGYAGLSLDQLIGSLGLTKGAFFHHFKSKNDLAKTLIRRYADEGIALFKSNFSRAKKLSNDPLQQLLLLVGLYEELFEGLTEPYPGCLLASYIYELQQFDDEVLQILNEEFLFSRGELTKLIEDIEHTYPPRRAVDRGALADAFMSIIEGAFILSKSLNEPELTARQLRLYRTLIEALFSPA